MERVDMYHCFYHWLDWYLGDMNDTIAMCGECGEHIIDYAEGKYDAHYPVPAIPLQVSWDYPWIGNVCCSMHVLIWRCLGDSHVCVYVYHE